MPWPVTANWTSSTRTRACSSPARYFTGVHGKGAWRDNVFIERLWRSIAVVWFQNRSEPAVSVTFFGPPAD